ncbi:MAG: DegV family protein [Anaerolineae bacterium]|nr:DegV family protein [Anaerolineae bacterium]
MHIVTDSGTDLNLSSEEKESLNIRVVPLVVSLDGKSYQEGIDIEPEDFYQLLAESNNLPVTSQPPAGEFAKIYREIAASDDEILSIHMTSGLSGTFNAAKAGAEMVPEANITHVDTKTLSAAAGWQVEAAARAAQSGWVKDKVISLMEKIGAASESMYTLNELKYLIHGGRISHMKGLLASMLNIKPLIGVEKVNGTYVQLGQVRTFKRALSGLVDRISERYVDGTKLKVQVLHAFNPEGAAMLRGLINQRFACSWLPTGPMSLVLGAHTGPSMVGVAFAPLEVFNIQP